MAIKKKIKKAAKPTKMKMTKEDLDSLASEYMRISEQVKTLSERKKELATIIKTGAVEIGTVDDKGSHYCDTDNFVCGNVCSKTFKLNNDKAYAYFSKHSDKEGNSFKDLIRQVTTYVVDEDEVANAVQQGRIDINTVRDNAYDVSVRYSVSVKNKEAVEELPEVEQTSLKKAARRK